MPEYIIGQRVVYRDLIGGEIIDVLCTVCPPENQGSKRPIDKDTVWINNPGRNYKHWVRKGEVKPLPNGQL